MNECSIQSCTNRSKYVKTGWCQTHYHRWYRHGDPHYVKHKRTDRGPKAYKTDTPKYRAVHARLTSERGKASEYDCIGCDKPAEQWAFSKETSEYQTQVVNGSLVMYTPDLQQYIPLCRGCHIQLDRYNNPPAFRVIGKRKAPE